MILLKKLIFLFILIIFKIQIFSETHVSKQINNIENWTSKLSPYIIDELVTIEKNGIVIINPGTEVKFKKGAKLLVNGVLYAKGNINNPVRFIPMDNESFYEGIYFNSAKKSTIEFSIMMRGTITIDSTQVVLNNNYILNSTGIILKRFSNAIIKNNYFFNNTYCIHIEGKNINFNIYENTFFNNRYGIYIKKTYTKKGIIRRNNFIDNKNNMTSYSIEQFDCKNNYWGTEEEKKISKTIIDKKINPKVGEIIFKPYAKDKFKLFSPPASYISLVKVYLSKKKPKEDIYRISLGGGVLGFSPLTPNYLNNENNFGIGYFATFTFNPLGNIMFGIETNFFSTENKDQSTYNFEISLSEFLLNVYGYFGYNNNTYFVPYAKIGNGICLVSEKYISKDAIFNGENTLNYNKISYSLSGGIGLEWFLMKFFSFKLECLYHYIFYPKGNISFPDIKISGNFYFETPFFLNK